MPSSGSTEPRTRSSGPTANSSISARRRRHLGAAGRRAVHPRRVLHRRDAADREDARRHRRPRHARMNIMGRIDHPAPPVPTTYALERGGETVEVDLPQAVSVLEEEHGLAERAAGDRRRRRCTARTALPLETRNRTTLCRCGHSSGKPLCDGTHREIGFREEPAIPKEGKAP
ncbi:CDGSH iron-sulfur domain-containing protein [Yinghuangia aomiensis]